MRPRVSIIVVSHRRHAEICECLSDLATQRTTVSFEGHAAAPGIPDDAGRSRFTRVFPTTHETIVRALHHTSVSIHAAVMFRTSVVRTAGMYSTAYPAAEDLEFFWRIARQHHVASLPITAS